MVPYCTIWYHIVQYDTILYNMISWIDPGSIQDRSWIDPGSILDRSRPMGPWAHGPMGPWAHGAHGAHGPMGP